MARYIWMCLAGAAAVMCSSVGVADAFHPLCPGCAVNATSSARAGSNNPMNYGLSDSVNGSALMTHAADSNDDDEQGDDQDNDQHRHSNGHHAEDRGGNLHHGKGYHRADDHGKGHHGRGTRGDDDQGNNQQGDDNDQGDGEHGMGQSSSGPPMGSKPLGGNPGMAKAGTVGSTVGHSVPEPGTAALLTVGLFGLAIRQLRRRARIRDQ